MIDATNLKAPGWQRIIADLSQSGDDDRTFLTRMLRILAQVSGARQAVLLAPVPIADGQFEARVDMVWPPLASDGGPTTPTNAQARDAGVEFKNDVQHAARAAFESGQSRVFGLDASSGSANSGGSSAYYTGSAGVQNQGFVLAITIPGEAREAGASRDPGAKGESPAAGTMRTTIAGVVTLVIEPRSADAVRSTLAIAELIAGYAHGHSARAALRHTATASAALDLGTRLIASINTATGFRGACLQLVNDLAKQFGADRVALGWVRNDQVRLVAISDVEHFDPRTSMVQKLAHAMDECLDQEQAIVFPVPPADGAQGDVVLSQAIAHAHRELASGNARLRVCSVPLRVTEEDEHVIGVVTFEGVVESGSAGAVESGHISLAQVELVQASMDLIAPVLKVRRSDDRLLAVRMWDSLLWTGAWLVGPCHTAWKLAGVTLAALLLFVTFYRTTYRPSADGVLEPRVRRVISTPYDGVLKSLGEGVEPGAKVTAGQVLVQMDTSEYELRLANAESRVLQARKQADAARSQKAQDKVVAAEKQEEQARSEADVWRSNIQRARIIAPISGTIIAGDVKERVGSTLKLGDPLFQIADLSDIMLTAKVDERDIALIRSAYDQQRGTGQVATRSLPDQAFDFQIERIVPLAVASEGRNTFEVRCALTSVAPWFRPGMEGVAKFNTERRSLLWIGTRRLMDQARLWLWW